MKRLNLPNEYNLIFGKQEHNDNIFTYTDNQELNKLKIVSNTDAIITNAQKTVIAVYTADCVPIFIFDQKNKIISIVHSGYKGTSRKIISKVINKLISEFNSKKEDLFIWIGSSISSCCYYARSKDQEKEFKKHFDSCLILRDGKYYLDLSSVLEGDILNLGIPKENIENTNTCTNCNIDFSSHFREGENRITSNINFIMLR